MVLKDMSASLNLSLSFKVEGFTYMVFATSDTMKCFDCGALIALTLEPPVAPGAAVTP